MVEDYIVRPDNDAKFRRKVFGIKYKNIEELKDQELIIFTTEDDKKYFVDKRRAHKKITSNQYKDISVDETNSNIIYCDTENKTHIYLRNKEGFLAKIDKTNLRFLNIINGTYYFASSLEGLQYDEALISISKQGEVKTFTNHTYHITSIFNPNLNLYLLSDGNYADIVKVENDELTTLYSHLFLPDYNNEAVLFKDGIISLNKDNKLDSINNLKNIAPLGNGLYKLWSLNGEGLWYTPLGLIKEPKKDTVMETLPNSKETFESTGIYVCGFKNIKTKNTDLVKITHQDKNIHFYIFRDFSDSKFLVGNLIALKKEANNKIYTCLFNKLGIKIIRVKWIYPQDGYREYEVYKIGKDYYAYNGIKLVLLALNPNKDMYIAGVRTELGDVAINTYNEQEFDSWLRYFNDSYYQKDIDDTLLKLYTPAVEEKYPNLGRRLK